MRLGWDGGNSFVRSNNGEESHSEEEMGSHSNDSEEEDEHKINDKAGPAVTK